MPLTSAVTKLSLDGVGSAGDYLRAVEAGRCEPADLLIVAVGAGSEGATGTESATGSEGGSGSAVASDETLDAVLGVSAAEVVAAGQLTGKAGQVASAVAKLGETVFRLVFIGVADRSARALRRAGAELARQVRSGESAVTDLACGLSPSQVSALAEGILLGSYRYSEKSADLLTAEGAGGTGGAPPAGRYGARARSNQVRLLIPPQPSGGDEAGDEAIERAAAIAAAVALTRDLANTPSLRKCPQWLAEAAAEVASGAGLRVRVWDEQQLAREGFGGIVAVGSGSARPPRLIELDYAPPGAERHVVLVGKGITFDSGGLSLKPNDGMKMMKTDMAGGGAVIAVMSALAKLGVSDRVTGLIAAAENLPSGSAYRPDDVLTHYGGKTVEVRNTDAEGRLVLADAIAYADAELAPDQIIDIATLTGAARVALGGIRAAMYSSCDELAATLFAAGEASGDRLWRMPLPDDYVDLLDSAVADLANVSAGDDGAGSITAALFLREFSGGRPWAHLDIAGAARSTTDDGELTAGATGFGTRLLLNWLTRTDPG